MQLWQNCAHSWRNCTVCTFVPAASLLWSYASVVHIANVGQGITKRTFSWQNASKCARRSAGPRTSCDSGSTLASVKPQPTRSTAYASLPAASSSGMSMRNSKQEASKLLRNTNGGVLPPAVAACEHVLKRSLVPSMRATKRLSHHACAAPWISQLVCGKGVTCGCHTSL